MHGALNSLLLQGPDAGKIHPNPVFTWWGGTTKSHEEPSWDCRGRWSRTWMFCSFRKVTVILAMCALLTFGHFFSRHSWWHHIFNQVKKPHGWWCQYSFVHGDNDSPETSSMWHHSLQMAGPRTSPNEHPSHQATKARILSQVPQILPAVNTTNGVTTTKSPRLELSYWYTHEVSLEFVLLPLLHFINSYYPFPWVIQINKLIKQ